MWLAFAVVITADIAALLLLFVLLSRSGVAVGADGDERGLCTALIPAEPAFPLFKLMLLLVLELIGLLVVLVLLLARPLLFEVELGLVRTNEIGAAINVKDIRPVSAWGVFPVVLLGLEA